MGDDDFLNVDSKAPIFTDPNQATQSNKFKSYETKIYSQGIELNSKVTSANSMMVSDPTGILRTNSIFTLPNSASSNEQYLVNALNELSQEIPSDTWSVAPTTNITFNKCKKPVVNLDKSSPSHQVEAKTKPWIVEHFWVPLLVALLAGSVISFYFQFWQHDTQDNKKERTSILL